MGYMKIRHVGEGLALAAALAGGEPQSKTVRPQNTAESLVHHESEPVGPDTFKDFILQTEVKPIFQNPEYFVYHEDGEYSAEEMEVRTEMVNGVGTIFHDVGLDFYLVQEGETREGIREKLEAVYPYLREQEGRMNGFNIAAKDVMPGLMLPVPVEQNERKISDQEFLKFAYGAIEEMEHDGEYGEFIHALREQCSDEKIAISLLAIAKQESGGKPIGQFELHRFEPKYDTFSYSIFHVLMMGPGETARKGLGMTVGQTYHPENAVKLFFGYMVEKILEPHVSRREKPEVVARAKKKFVELFELDERFVSFYNGRAWKMMNPEYLEQIQGYYGEAQHYFWENGAVTASLEPHTKTP